MKSEDEKAVQPKVRWSLRFLEALVPAALTWTGISLTNAAYSHLESHPAHAIFQLMVSAFCVFGAFFYLMARLKSSSSS